MLHLSGNGQQFMKGMTNGEFKGLLFLELNKKTVTILQLGFIVVPAFNWSASLVSN